MSKRRRWIVVLCVTIAAALGAFFAADKEPRYRGHSMSHWLTVCYTAGLPREQAEEAVESFRHIGTNALPFLLAGISYEPSPTKQSLARTLDRLPRWMVSRRLYLWA